MTTLAYTSGNPANLTSGALANMADVQGPLIDVRTYINGKNLDEGQLANTTLQRLGLNDGSQVGRGAVDIPTPEARTNVAYGLLPTPDQVSGIVLPTKGLIFVAYQATWQQSVSNSLLEAAICLNGTPVVEASTTATPITASAGMPNGTAGRDTPLSSYYGGLRSTDTQSVAYTGDVTTGQVVGSNNASNVDRGGPCTIFAAAGTYAVTVQFRVASGSLTVKNRKLWVWSMAF